MTRTERTLRRLLEEAQRAIFDELHAAGESEIQQHPTLRQHSELHARITRALESTRPKKKAYKLPRAPCPNCGREMPLIRGAWARRAQLGAVHHHRCVHGRQCSGWPGIARAFPCAECDARK